VGKRGPKRKTATAAPRVAADLDGWDAPGHLSDEARAAWHHVVSMLAAKGNLGRTDPTLVECYAVNVALLRQAQAVLALDGPLVVTDGKWSSHPANMLINSATMRIKAIINDLGLCPASSQHAASASHAKPQDESKWSDLLGTVG
jgi:P27 family predicted phage terminase small subunit